jgi:hypothetical protein
MKSAVYSLPSSLLDVFYDGRVHAPFGHKLASMLMHVRQKSLSFLINKGHRGYHDCYGPIVVSDLSPRIFQHLNPNTRKSAFEHEHCPRRRFQQLLSTPD